MFELLNTLPLRAKLGGKSLWSLRYTSGRVVSEPDCDWSLAPQEHRQSVRLYCPNGQIAELGSGDCTGRLFQLKHAEMRAGQGSRLLAHVVGLVCDADGNCTYAAWLYDRQKLAHGKSNVYRFSYEGNSVGHLAFDHIGLRAS